MAVSEFSDVFVSYRRKNVDFTKQIVDALRKEDKEVWVDWEDIPPGSVGFTGDIQKGIEGADTFICVLSPDYMESDYCLMELDHAIKMNKKLIPIVYAKFDAYEIPSGIGHINWIYFVPHAGQDNTFQESFPKVMDAIDTDLEHVRYHKRLLIRAIEWQNNDEKNGFLLVGDELDEASSWVVENANLEPHPTNLQLRYVDVSRKIAERRQRQLLTGVSVALMVSIVLTILSVYFYAQAEQARFDTNVRLLANRLPAISANNPFTARSISEAMLAIDTIPMIASAAAQTNLLTSAAFDQYNDHNDIVSDVEFINDGAQFITASSDGTLKLWNLPDNRVSRTYQDASLTGGFRSIAISPDESMFLSGTLEGMIALWDADSDTLLDTFDIHTGDIFSIVFVADGTEVISGDTNGLLYRWELASGDILATYETNGEAVYDIAVTDDENLMITGMDNGELYLWDVESGDLLANIAAHNGEIYGVDITDDSKYVVSGSADNDVRLWRLETIEQSETNDSSNTDPAEDAIYLIPENRSYTGHVDEVWDVMFNHTNDKFISVSGDRTVRVWDFDQRSSPRVMTGHSGWINAVAISPDDNLVVTTADDSTAILWDLQRSSLIWQNRIPDQRVLSSAVNADESVIAAGLADGGIVFIDGDTQAISNPIFETTSRTEAMTFMPDGTLLSGHCLDPDENPCTVGEVLHWDVDTQTVINRYSFNVGLVTDLDAGTNDDIGQFFVVSGTGFDDASNETPFDVILANENGQEIGRFIGHTKGVDGIAISPDGQYLITGSRDVTARIWQINNQEFMAELTDHEDWVSEAGWFPDGMAAMTASWDGTLIEWDLADLENPRVVREYEGHQGAVMEVIIAPDGKTALSGSRDSVVLLWDIDNGEPIRVLDGHTDDVISLHWSADGNRAYSASFDGTVRYWQVLLDDIQAIENTLEGGNTVNICERSDNDISIAEEYSVIELCGNLIERTRTYGFMTNR